MKSKERIKGYEYLRAVACIAIIFIHAIFSAIVLFGKGLTLGETVLYRSILNCLMWAVPCFLMITGALLLDRQKRISYNKLFSKYIWRVLKAVIVFGVIFTVLELIFSTDGSGIRQFFTGLYEVFAGKSWSHMWYLYCLIGLYLLLPFYKKIAAHSTESELGYLLIVYLIFLSLVPLLKIWGIECGFYIHVSSIYPFWFFLGYYFKIKSGKPGKLFWGGMAVAGTLLLILFTWIRWKWNIESMEKLFGYSSVFVIIQTVGIFGLFSEMKLEKAAILGKALENLDSHSFGIYLIHLIFVRGIYKQLKFNPFEHGGMLAIAGVVAVSLILAYLLDWLLKKVPVFRGML